MGSDESGRLLIDVQTYGEVAAADLIKLTASMQRRFPAYSVEPADPQWLKERLEETLWRPTPMDELTDAELDRLRSDSDYDGLPTLPELALPAPEYVYLVLAWLGGTVSKQVADQAIKAAADLVRKWMRARRSKNDAAQIAYILGPDGEVLKKVTVRPRAPVRRSPPRRRR